MNNFGANKYIHNTQIKRMCIYIYIYICEKQQIKLFSSKTFLVDKSNQKIARKMLSQVDLICFIMPELSRAKAKNSYTLNVDNILNMTSK